MNSFTPEFTPEQKEIIEISTNIPKLLVVAGAGAGKTKTIIDRISYLLSNKYCNLDQILLITFTKKAAGELSERIFSKLESMAIDGNSDVEYQKKIRVCTFHGFCHTFINENKGIFNINGKIKIIQENEAIRLVNELIINRSEFSNVKLNRNSVKKWLSEFFVTKNSMTPFDDSQKVFDEFYKSLGYLFYDDLIIMTLNKLKQDKKMLLDIQNKFPFIFVDEFQDTNIIQYELIDMISTENGQLVCVGDDSQSIYGFRGAQIRNMINYANSLHGKHVYFLSKNFRSDANIVNLSSTLFDKNENFFNKKIVPFNKASKKVIVCSYKDQEEEAQDVAQRIFDHLNEPNNFLCDICVLYRNNNDTKSLEKALDKLGVQYDVSGGEAFLREAEVKLSMYMIDLLFKSSDIDGLHNLLKIIKSVSDTNIPSLRKIIKNATYRPQNTSLIEHLADSLPDYKILSYIKETVEKYFILLDKSNTVDDAINILSEYMEELYMDGYVSGFAKPKLKIDNVNLLVKKLALFLNSKSGTILNYRELVYNFRRTMVNFSNGVNLMSIHNSKGLEFKHVFLISCCEHLYFYDGKEVSIESIREEKRVFYVGLTRAQHTLRVSYYKKSFFNGKYQDLEPVRFLKMLNKKNIIDVSPNPLIIDDEYNLLSTPKKLPPLAKYKPLDVVLLEKQKAIEQCPFKCGDKVSHDRYLKGIVQNVFVNSYGVVKVKVKFIIKSYGVMEVSVSELAATI